MDKQPNIKQTADVIREAVKIDLNNITNNTIWAIVDADRKLNRGNTMPELLSFKSRRNALKLSLRDVADLTGVSPATISRIERGMECDYSNVKALYEFYEKK